MTQGLGLMAEWLAACAVAAPHAAESAGVGAGSGGSGSGGAIVTTAPWWVTFVPLLPLAGAVFSGIVAAAGVRRGKAPAWMTVGLIGAAFTLVLAAFLGWGGLSGGSRPMGFTAFEWIGLTWGPGPGQSLSAGFGFYLDGLSLMWMLFVTGLGALIALYASEYMEHDVGPDYCRFFGAFGLFVFSMACLVMADNLVLLFLGWEGVGLCSYLLIGYFYKRPAAVEAAKKAFIVNRIGDLGLLMGLLLAFTTFGTVEFAPMFELIADDRTASGAVLSEQWQVWGIPLLLCAGAFGKSAQLFFYVWLPDAMEGPTPVSALIHAATMVTAGVYLVARFTPLMLADPELIALTVVTWSGTITALWAATIAMAQFDIKRIMGYSTVSQLGYMFAGLGLLTTAGGAFHVFTHAFFKATLFLACGAVMHGFAGQLDMRKLSGLWGVPGFRVVCVAMLIGCLNLAGVPGTAGYFSKDMILAEAFVTPHGAIWGSWAAGLVLLLTAGLTAYYTFRVFLRVFVGPTIYEPGDEVHAGHGDAHGHDDHHAHDDHGHGHEHAAAHAGAGHHDAGAGHFHPHAPRWAMNLVLVALSVGSVLAAGLYFVGGGPDGAFAKAMVHASSADLGDLPWAHHGEAHGDESHGDQAHGDESHDAEHTDHAEHGGHAEHAPAVPPGLAAHADLKGGTIAGLDPHTAMYFISAAVGLAGIAAAYGLHYAGRTSADKVRADAIASAIAPVSRWAERKWLVDELYGYLIVTPLRLVSHVSHYFDKLVIDLIVDSLGRSPRWLASLLRPSQNGRLHGYAARMAGGVAVVLVVVILLVVTGRET